MQPIQLDVDPQLTCSFYGLHQENLVASPSLIISHGWPKVVGMHDKQLHPKDVYLSWLVTQST